MKTELSKVAVVMGSDSDLAIMQRAVETLNEFDVPHVVRILSAHRTPEAARHFAYEAVAHGIRVVIAGAGGAAHLAGFMAAHTILPVLGVPLPGSALLGFDALLSTVQMPPGVPVGTLGVGEAGARNAALLAVEILALSDPALRAKLQTHRKRMADDVAAKDERLQTPP